MRVSTSIDILLDTAVAPKAHFVIFALIRVNTLCSCFLGGHKIYHFVVLPVKVSPENQRNRNMLSIPIEIR